MKKHPSHFLVWLALLFFFLESTAQDTRTVYLSGTGFDRTATWEFFCTSGRKSGEWATIEVPSCWEQQGFGSYNYGHDPFDERLKEEGHYRLRFQAAREWKGKHVRLVFEGVMTDCMVQINGVKAGEVHRGAFYRFGYDVSSLLEYGSENLLEVFVKKFSDDMSVNHAERKADYWIFGGIFRPVYLQIKPSEHIRRVAVDAQEDGSFRADVYTGPIRRSERIQVRFTDAQGNEKGRFETSITKEDGPFRIAGNIGEAVPWTPEFPHLYTAQFSLLDANGTGIHRLSERIGFRTVEVRPQDGIYVNGVRIKFKGVNRHTFHPDHGRTSSRDLSIEAVNLMKDMNMNAVRMSHYPPDVHFLDACDSLGLFVLDELAGWQRPPYDSAVGRKLLGEMIARDANHPCVVMWNNGNEGGWNTSYDEAFGQLDIQQREVNHPWQAFRKSNTAHYITYDYLSLDHFEPRQVFFPTEMIHGLYDGGHGAGLEDYWFRMWNHPLCAGGFLWVFADEAVKRTDTGELDSDGNHAPDGILGPYHEKEGSFYTIREIWSPVHIEKRYITPGFDGTFRIQNRFHYTTLDQCSFRYYWKDLPNPESAAGGQGLGERSRIMDSGIPAVDPLEPGQSGLLYVDQPQDWMNAEVLYLEAHDPHGRPIHLWSWPVRSPASVASEILSRESNEGSRVEVSETENGITLEASGVRIRISKQNGRLVEATGRGGDLPLKNGPLFGAQPEISVFRHFGEQGSHRVVASYANGDSLEWTMHSSGLIDMVLKYRPEAGQVSFTGASFSYPEDRVASVRYMGNGPYRVWKNRLKGVNFDVWDKTYNTTITGHSGYDYPEFKGYYSNLYWATFSDSRRDLFTVISHTEDLFLRLWTPGEPPDPANTAVSHPPGDVSFMAGIPAIGTKFKQPGLLGPQSRPYRFMARRVKEGCLDIKLTFDFR